MDRIIKIVGWVVVAVLALVVWTFFPEAQTIIACLLAAILIFYVFFATVKGTVGQLIGDQTSSPFAVSHATMPPCCSHSMVECKGKDLCDMPLIDRKRKLLRLLARTTGIHFVDHSATMARPCSGTRVLMKLEGILSKRADAPYRSGPSKVRLKSKNPDSEAVRRETEEDWNT